MSETDDTMNMPCMHCGKMIPVELPTGPTKFGSHAVTCPHCKQTNFVEVTTEIEPDTKADMKTVWTVFHEGKHGIEGDPKPGTRYVYSVGRNHVIVEEWEEGQAHPLMVAGPFQNEADALTALKERDKQGGGK